MKQPTHNFNIESRPDKSGKQLIFLNFNYGYKEHNVANQKEKYIPLRISTQWRIEKIYWKDKPDYRANKTYVAKYGKDLNNALERLETTAYNQLSIYRNQHLRNPNPEELKILILEKLGRAEKISTDILITKFIESQIGERRILPSNSKKYWSNNTIKQYENLKAHIEFHQARTNTQLSFAKLNKTQYWDIFNSINKRHKKNNGIPIKHNTIAKICKHLRVILKAAASNDIEIGFKWDNPDYKINEVNTENNTGLDEAQLLTIYNTDTTHSREFNNARNYILFSSLTALRIGDMVELNTCKVETYKVNDEEFKGFQSRIRKAKDNSNELLVVIPLSKILLEIIEQNNGHFPKFPCKPVIGRQIKKFLKFLEFKDNVGFKERYYGNPDYVNEYHEQHEVFSPHSCRYTFITNMSKLGIPESVVKNITHPTNNARSILDGYNLSTMQDNANTLKKHINKTESVIYNY